jgi:helix-turn-helix protein
LDQPWWGSRETLALSISEAASVCGVKRRTIRRRHQAGEFEHAFKDEEGSWRIPVSDLAAAGLRPNVVTDPDEPRIVFSAASQVDRLRTEVAVLRERVRALEIIAREREERVSDLRTILRMLPAAGETVQPLTQAAEEPPSAEVDEEPSPDEGTDEPLPEAVWEGAPWITPRAPTPSGEQPLPERVTSPVDAPIRAASSEPVVILPDTPGREIGAPEQSLEQSAELLEGARQRSAELLDDAMSLWWPSPGRPSHDRGPTPLESGAAGRFDRSSHAVAATVSDETKAHPIMTETPQPAAQPLPQPPVPEDDDRYLRESIDETSFDWLDPNFGRPPRHLRRRLGRFFRRNRRPR